MPLIHQQISHNRALGFWKITESEEDLYNMISEYVSIPDTISHINKRLEFIAGRVLVKELLNKLRLPFNGITKNQHGKPFLENHFHQLSLSHSYPYVAALIDADRPVGIDLEQIKPKLLKIAPRVLHTDEFRDAGENPVKHCIYWCAKEALLKIHGVKDLTFAENLIISPFPLQNEGELIGRIIVDGTARQLSLHYNVYTDFVVVYNN